MAKNNITYNEAMEELNEILASIENDDVDVDLLSEKVKKALILIKLCKTKLQNTETEVSKILEELNDLDGQNND